MILLASGDFAEQKEILNKIVAYRCIVFLRNVAPSSDNARDFAQIG